MVGFDICLGLGYNGRMSKIDKIEEQIGWLKVVFGLLVAMTASLVGWMASNYNNTDALFMLSAVILVIIFVYGIVVVNLKAFDKINELEEL